MTKNVNFRLNPFFGSHEAAKRSGMLYSLFGTCKLHGIEPYAWLKTILQKIPPHPINKIHDLLTVDQGIESLISDAGRHQPKFANRNIF